MERRSILIADSSEPFRSTLEDALRNEFQTYTCDSGKTALDLLETLKPDLFVLDLTLPDLDGISLLRAAADSECMPCVLALTRLVSDYVIASLAELDVSYILTKPCMLQAVVSNIQHMAKNLAQMQSKEARYDTRVEACLLSLNIMKKRRGFACLREALKIFPEDPDQTMTKHLYPAIGDRCQGNGVQVERAIRSAIDTAWKNRSEAVWGRIFTPDSKGEYHRPSNYVFIASIHKYVTERMVGSRPQAE